MDILLSIALILVGSLLMGGVVCAGLAAWALHKAKGTMKP